jgi:hypothetical protein
VYCVWLKEITKKNIQGVEWFLLTDIETQTNQEALNIIELYGKRWTIEDFHKCYKTGCSIEKRQFDSRKTLANIIALLALPAVVLLRSRYFATTDPTLSIQKIIRNKETITIVQKLADKYLKPIDLTLCKKNTALWWILLLGRMGGHQGFKQKGMPGWQTIWKGYVYFLQITEMNQFLANST